MDTTNTKQRRSPYTRRPRANAAPESLQLHDHDLRNTFLPLYRHGPLPTSYICAFHGGSAGAVKNRLSRLYEATYRDPDHYLHRADKRWHYIIPRTREQIHHVGDRALQALFQRGLIPDFTNPLLPKPQLDRVANLPHSVMISTTSASFELGVRNNPDFRLYAWYEIWDALAPDRKTVANPFTLPVDVSKIFGDRIERKSFDLTPDAICVIRNNKTPASLGIAIEAEHHKQADASTLERTSFLKTFLAYRAIRNVDRLQLFGATTSFMVCAVTISQRHIDTMKAIVMRETHGAGSSQFLFRAVPVIGTPEGTPQPRPDTTLFTGPWQRAGYPDFFLNAFCDKEKGRP